MGILIVDDDDLFRRAVRRALGADASKEASTLEEGFLMTIDEQPLVYLVDVHFAGPRTGLDAVPGFRALAPFAEIVIATGSTRREHMLQAEALGCYGYIGKTEVSRAVAFLRAASRRARARTEEHARVRAASAASLRGAGARPSRLAPRIVPGPPPPP